MVRFCGGEILRPVLCAQDSAPALLRMTDYRIQLDQLLGEEGHRE
jgi:hypothetical protein